MIDPNTIIVQQNNKSNVINIACLNDFDYNIPVYDLNGNEKDFSKYCKDIERIVRQSFEYKQFCKYLRDEFGMNKCAFLENASNEESFDVRIELHHYPYSLFDIVNIIYRKRSYHNESLSPFMVAAEVLSCHYQLLVGLIPLSETVHQLVHSGKLFIPVNKVFGRYKLFTDIYYPFIEPEMLDSLKMIEKATEENSEVGDTTILNTNHIRYNITDKRYQLPQIGTITDSMINRIEMIKNNNYILPTLEESKQIEDHQNKKYRQPLRYINKTVE